MVILTAPDRRLLSTRLNRLYPGGDMVLMAELALKGRFLLLPEILLYRREGRETSPNRLNPGEEAIWLDPLRTGGIKSPLLLLHRGYIGAALRAPISCLEKVKTVGLLFAPPLGIGRKSAANCCRRLNKPELPLEV